MKNIVLIKILGIVLLIVGIVVRYWVGRRRFNRRNFAGVEIFDSYGKAVIARGFERFVSFLATICVLFGIIFLLYIIIHS
jgi:hypothetical protein